MNIVSSDVWTFEVARALDQRLSKKIGDSYTSYKENVRLVSAMFALHDAGFIFSESLGRATMFAFSPKAVDLDRYGYIPQEKLVELAENQVRLKLKKSEISRSVELSKRYLDEIEKEVVQKNWSDVASVIDYVLHDNIRVIGPASKGGMIVEHLTRSKEDEKCFVWFALGGETQQSLMIDLAEPVMLKKRPCFPTKHDEHSYVTLGFFI